MLCLFSGNIDEFCKANPTLIVPHPDTCGQYYNCSAMSKYGHHLQECHYPDLFDEVSLTCKDFEQVKCNQSKHEPEAPCKYSVYLFTFFLAVIPIYGIILGKCHLFATLEMCVHFIS